MTDPNHLHFGHGRFACPGRQLALTNVKMTAASLLLNFDMRFEKGSFRPKNISVHEIIFPEPASLAEFRRHLILKKIPALDIELANVAAN
jgi:cytochrome P450